MATKFLKGEVVRLAVPVPQGPIVAFRMDEDGSMSYLVQWTDDEVVHERWFTEEQLEAV